MTQQATRKLIKDDTSAHSSEDSIFFSDALDEATNFLRLIATFSRQAQKITHSIGNVSYHVGKKANHGHFWVGKTNFHDAADNELIVMNEGYHDPEATLRFLAFIAKHFDQEPIRAYFFHSNGGPKINLLDGQGIEKNIGSLDVKKGDLALVFKHAPIKRQLQNMGLDKKAESEKRKRLQPHDVGLFYNRTFLRALKQPVYLESLIL